MEFITHIDFTILFIAGFFIGGITGYIDACIMYKEVFGYWPKNREIFRCFPKNKIKK